RGGDAPYLFGSRYSAGAPPGNDLAGPPRTSRADAAVVMRTVRGKFGPGADRPRRPHFGVPSRAHFPAGNRTGDPSVSESPASARGTGAVGRAGKRFDRARARPGLCQPQSFD